MNITLKKTSLTLLLAIASLSASMVFGQPSFQDGGFLRVAQNERNRGQEQKAARQERGRSRDRSDDNRQNAERNDTRGGGMSAEERRALRQQIDEAGREIYQRRR